MSGSRTGSRGWLAVLGLAAIAGLLLAAALSGCGSGGGGESTSASTVAGETTSGAAGPGEGSGGKPGNREDAGKGKGSSQNSKRTGSHGSDRQQGSKQGSGAPKGRRQASGNGQSGEEPLPPKAKRKLEKACPSGMSQRQCRAYVEGSAQAEETPSTAVSEPQDCTKVMSRSECEEVLQQQKAAEGEGGSVDVDRCLAHPTPRCEEVLKEEIERQRAGG